MRLPLFPTRRDPSEHAPSTDEVQGRLPLPAYPAGWYGVAFSHEVAAGEVKRIQFAGREVVAFRTESGQAAVFEAHCPHLGAHFGHGGCVMGETLRCPMHDFRFSVDGACTAVGVGHSRPPSARAAVVHVRERCGVILAWHHPGGAAPSWEPPPLADPSLTAGPSQRRQIVIRSHVQELGENLFDVAHLAAVHGYEDPAMIGRPAAEGHVIRGQTRLFHVTALGPFTRRVQVDLTTSLYGLGIVLFDSVASPGGLSFRGAFTPNPVAPGRVEFRLSVWIKQVDEGLAAAPLFRGLPRRTQEELMGRMLALTMMRDVRQDQAVLEHKRHLARPGLADGDGPVSTFRRWARQFYPEAQRGAAPREGLEEATTGEEKSGEG